MSDLCMYTILILSRSELCPLACFFDCCLMVFVFLEDHFYIGLFIYLLFLHVRMTRLLQ